MNIDGDSDSRRVDLPRSIAASVNQDRLWSRLMQLAEVGAIDGGGVNRQALSEEDTAARNLLISWGRARGYSVETDEIANIFLRRPGRESSSPVVLAGSHLDTQPLGGRFDGILGVVGALEAMEALDDAGVETYAPIELAVWTNEEGGRFRPGAMGSMVFSRRRTLDEFLQTTDGDGTSMAAALASSLSGLDVDAKRTVKPKLKCYVELHIEQGPILEKEGVVIGAVTGIQGARWFDVLLRGKSAHAGTTPLNQRHDALGEAIDLAADLRREMSSACKELRFTIGRMDVKPNAPNTVAEEVSFSIDLRHPDAAQLDRLTAQISRQCSQHQGRCSVELKQTLDSSPCRFPGELVEIIERTATSLHLPSRRIASGAFHDALFIADVCPSCMIFVPSVDGISHNPLEFTKPEDTAAGARVLAAVLAELASRPA